MVPEPNRADAGRFAAALTGDENAICDWAHFPDQKPGTRPAGRLRGSLASVWDRLVDANAAGNGVFMTINESSGGDFLDASIINLRAAFVDDDKADPPVTFETLRDAGLAPSITVQSGNGEHNYWSLVPGEDLAQFTSLQKSLAAKFGTDSKISNVGRVMRVPGFWHQKDPSDPFLVELLRASDARCTVAQIRAAFDLGTDAPINGMLGIDLSAAPAAGPANRPFAKIGAQTYAPLADRIQRAQAYVAKMEPAIEGQEGDHQTLVACAVAVRDFDLDDDSAAEALATWNATCQPPWSDDELALKIQNARRYGSGEFGSKVAAEERRPPVDESRGREARPAWTLEDAPLVRLVPAGKDSKELRQLQPSADQIAQHARDLVRYTNHIVASFGGFGNKFFKVSPANIASPGSRETLVADVVDTCAAMMVGKMPTPETFGTAVSMVSALPRDGAQIPLMRWAGETHLAMHEIPVPREGDWSAHREFVDRCSCPDTLMAWVWTIFLDEKQTGREALLLHGSGNDGKSYFCEVIMKFLGPVATASEILKGENRFELSGLVGKRLAYFGDFRNPRPIHSKIMREIISGAFLATEKKGKDIESAYFHPRVLMSTNVEPRIMATDRAEFTRIRRINVKPLENNEGDRSWPGKLLAQMPAFLYACREVYERFVTAGKDLPITQACRDALEGGAQATNEEFEYLSARLDFAPDAVISSKRLTELFRLGGLREWDQHHAREWLKSRGATNRTPSGTQIVKKVRNKSVACWVGVREIEDEHPILLGLKAVAQSQQQQKECS